MKTSTDLGILILLQIMDPGGWLAASLGVAGLPSPPLPSLANFCALQYLLTPSVLHRCQRPASVPRDNIRILRSIEFQGWFLLDVALFAQ